MAWRSQRDADAVERALVDLRAAAVSGENIMPASIAASHAGVTTGEWAGTLREVFGEYRAPTGIGGAAGGSPNATGKSGVRVQKIRDELEALSETLGRRPKLLVGKPGLDGHSNGAEQIAIKARDVGFDVVYEGIRVTPAQLVTSALEEGVHLVGLSILSGSHLALVPEVVRGLREAGLDVPVIVGGIIPDADAEILLAAGVARVFTPKDFELDRIMEELVELVREAASPENV